MSDKLENDDLIVLKLKPYQLIVIFSALTLVLGFVFGYSFRDGQIKMESFYTPTPEFVEADEPEPTATSEPVQSPTAAPTDIPAPTPTAVPDYQTGVGRYDVSVDDDPFIGPEDAPITIIEFSSFNCGYCARFHNETFGQLIENYGDLIRFVYRDFPILNGQFAAEAANCAGDQDNYWEFHDKVFTTDLPLNSNTFLQFAEELELDIEIFQECVDSRTHQDEVQADYENASQLRLRYTPTFFINGIPLIGAQPFDNFAVIIDAELAQLEE